LDLDAHVSPDPLLVVLDVAESPAPLESLPPHLARLVGRGKVGGGGGL
jgi:hypothetical protein